MSKSLSPAAASLAPAVASLALVAVILAGGVLAACATGPVQWRKSGAGEDQWSRDKAECRRHARVEAERRFGETASEVGSSAYGSGQTFEKSMARFDAERDQRRLYENCLKARGHRKISAPPAK